MKNDKKQIYCITYLPNSTGYKAREVEVSRGQRRRRYVVRMPHGRNTGRISLHSFRRAQRMQFGEVI